MCVGCVCSVWPAVHKDDMLSLSDTCVCVARNVQNGWTSLFKACANGHDIYLSFCFSYVCVARIVQDGSTSLFLASAFGHDKVAGLLLQKAADVNAATKVSKKKKVG